MQTQREKGEGVIQNREVRYGDCGIVVSEMNMCEVCDICHHAKCEGVSDEAYTVLQVNGAMNWY